MTKNISEEELLLRKRARRRLVGAIVLVVFSVIVLPIIFDEPKSENEQHEIAINLPAPTKMIRGDLAPLPKTEVTGHEALDKTDAPVELKDRSKINPQHIEEIIETFSDRKHIPIPGIKPKIDKHPIEVKSTNQTSTISSNIHSSHTADAAKGYVIQLGAFSDPSKAKQQHTSLLSSGFKAYTETLRIDNHEVTRVRIGPFVVKSAAEDELKKLKKLGFDGVVAPR